MKMEQREGYIIFNPNKKAKVKLMCFHHAGGSALSFIPLVRTLPKDVEAYLFELPGRGISANQKFVANFSEAMAYFLPKVIDCMDRPTVFLGHSLGGLFSYAISGSLSKKQNYIEKVIISAAKSPQTVLEYAIHPEKPFIVRSRDSVKMDIEALGGIPVDVDDSLLHSIINITGNDFHLLDTFTLDGVVKSSFPFELWLGKYDTAVHEREIYKWREEIQGEFCYRYFNGGHFFISESTEPADLLKETLLNIMINIENKIV
ncbi:Surfactin synthase thioesterase subunit [Virgibacillus dokdonensis]|uniref:Surfactin synthase thioesterase subunit n=2 Tax=Bacillaceae TaxID=186817 RepID=A0A2K9J5T3_9BACI|nr:Surfactin synthase thioesterase subunit [Virgibacillus dokdonensis]